LSGYGGIAKGHLSMSNDPKQPGVSSLRLEARDIDLATLPLKEWSGLDAVGKLQLKADLSALVPPETATGAVTLALDGAGTSGGSIKSNPTADTLSGNMSMLTGMPIPKVSLGHVEGAVAVEKGVARLEKTQARGGDIDADLDGNVSLRPLFSLSQADLHVRFRPSEKWLDANAMIKGAMGLLQNAKQGDGSYAYSFSGPLSRMTPRPGR
jgi:type II secretion system protein N